MYLVDDPEHETYDLYVVRERYSNPSQGTLNRFEGSRPWLTETSDEGDMMYLVLDYIGQEAATEEGIQKLFSQVPPFAN